MISIVLLASATAVSAPPATQAKDADDVHAIYFNRPGATLADLDADAKRCATLAARTVPTAQSAGGGLMGALVSGMAAGIRKGQEQQRNYETCMVVGGWRVVFLDQAEAEKLKADVARDRTGAITPLAGAPDITFGRIGRTWANDYAEPRITGENQR